MARVYILGPIAKSVESHVYHLWIQSLAPSPRTHSLHSIKVGCYKAGGWEQREGAEETGGAGAAAAVGVQKVVSLEAFAGKQRSPATALPLLAPHHLVLRRESELIVHGHASKARLRTKIFK